MFKKAIKFLGARLSFLILIIILVAAAVVSGLMLGYGILGGGKPTHIFSHELWQAFFNKINPK